MKGPSLGNKCELNGGNNCLSSPPPLLLGNFIYLKTKFAPPISAYAYNLKEQTCYRTTTKLYPHCK